MVAMHYYILLKIIITIGENGNENGKLQWKMPHGIVLVLHLSFMPIILAASPFGWMDRVCP